MYHHQIEFEAPPDPNPLPVEPFGPLSRLSLFGPLSPF
jgi:hypothetical protein